MISHLFKNGIIVTVNPQREIFFHGAAAIKDDRIVEVGPSEALEARYTDCEQVTALKGWMETMTFPAASNLTPEDCYHGAMLGLMVGIHSGIKAGANKKADLVIFDPYECIKAVPLHNPCSTLVYSASLKNITDVYVDGRAVMEKGAILTVEDEKTELKAAQRAAEELCVRGNITNRLEGHKWNNTYRAYERRY